VLYTRILTSDTMIHILSMSTKTQWIITAVVGVFVVIFFLYSLITYIQERSSIDRGSLTEKTYTWNEEDGLLPKFTEVTALWGLDEWSFVAEKQLRGAVAIADIDGDGLNDIIFGGKYFAVFFSSSTSKFIKATNSLDTVMGEVVSVNYGDIDSDTKLDILIGTDSGQSVILWGGDWVHNKNLAEVDTTILYGGKTITNVIAADLSSDNMIDILSLSYGSESFDSEDSIFEQISPRNFKRIKLPNSDRYTLAAEIADLDSDGNLDIWVARDVGWRKGADSLYTKLDGEWQDRAEFFKTDIEIDAMSVTIADFDGNNTLDAYVSDVGDNELLLNIRDSFIKDKKLGLARIRPLESDKNVVSSTWGSGVSDFNSDGRLDLLVVNGGFKDDVFENKIKGTEVLINDRPSLFMQKRDGTYADIWNELGLDWDGTSRGLSIGDLDNDGDADFIIMNHNDIPKVYRNDTESESLKVSLPATCSKYTGSTLSIKSDTTGDILKVFPSHSFLGAHAPELVTAKGENMKIELIYKGQTVFTETLTNRDIDHVVIACD